MLCLLPSSCTPSDQYVCLLCPTPVVVSPLPHSRNLAVVTFVSPLVINPRNTDHYPSPLSLSLFVCFLSNPLFFFVFCLVFYFYHIKFSVSLPSLFASASLLPSHSPSLQFPSFILTLPFSFHRFLPLVNSFLPRRAPQRPDNNKRRKYTSHRGLGFNLVG